MPAAFAQPFHFDDLPLRHEPGLRCGFLNELVEAGVLHLIGASAALADQQDAMMVVAQMLAGRIDIAAFDFVQEAVLEEEIQRAIDRRRRDRLMLRARQFFDDRIGAQRGRRLREYRKNLLAQWRQLQAFVGAELRDLRGPRPSVFVVMFVRVHVPRHAFP